MHGLSAKLKILVPILLVSGIAGGFCVAIGFMFLPGGPTTSLALAYLGLAVFFSLILAGISIVVGLPAYFVASRFFTVTPVITTIIGTATGIAVGLSWGRGMFPIFSAAGFTSGLVAGLLLVRSNKALQGTSQKLRKAEAQFLGRP